MSVSYFVLQTFGVMVIMIATQIVQVSVARISSVLNDYQCFIFCRTHIQSHLMSWWRMTCLQVTLKRPSLSQKKIQVSMQAHLRSKTEDACCDVISYWTVVSQVGSHQLWAKRELWLMFCQRKKVNTTMIICFLVNHDLSLSLSGLSQFQICFISL